MGNGNGIFASEAQKAAVKARVTTADDEIPVAIDPNQRQAEAEARELQEKQAEERIPGLFKFLREMELASKAKRDVNAEEIRRYRIFIDKTLADRSSSAITKRRIVIRELLRDQFGRTYKSFEQVQAMLESLVEQNVLVRVEVIKGTKPQDNPDVHVWLHDVLGGIHAYRVSADANFEQPLVAEIKKSFESLYNRVSSEIFKVWEHQVQAMKYKSTLTLQEALDGRTGVLHIHVPSQGRLEGGWLLLAVESLGGRGEGTKLSILDVCGDPDEGRGFAFVSAVTRIMALRPHPFLPGKQLHYWSAFPMKDKKFVLPAFYESHPNHVNARVLMHATLVRAIRVEAIQGRITSGIPYLQSEPQERKDVVPVSEPSDSEADNAEEKAVVVAQS